MKPTCGTEGCDRPVRAYGMCWTHYDRSPAVNAAKATCNAEDCDRPVRAKGLCQTHYDRMRSRGRVRRDDRTLINRARNRATAALIKAHQEEFTELLAKATSEVQQENEVIEAAARKVGVVPVKTLRLKPGPPAAGEGPGSRTRIELAWPADEE